MKLKAFEIRYYRKALMIQWPGRLSNQEVPNGKEGNREFRIVLKSDEAKR